MPINAGCWWEIRTGGADTNGGFFKQGASGQDFSTQNAPQYAIGVAGSYPTQITSSGAGNVILTAYAAADMVGNGLYTVSGTNQTNGSWFEITSVVVGVSITVSTNAAGTAIATGAIANGVVNIGGAFKLGGTRDDDVFEAGTAGNKYWIAAGTYTLGEAIATALTGTNIVSMIEGYASTRGDKPIGATRPVISGAGNGFSTGSNWEVSYLSVTGTSSITMTQGSGTKIYFCKVLNTSTTAGRTAISGSGDGFLLGCEAVALRGIGILLAGTTSFACWAHDSDIAYKGATTGLVNICRCIGSSCVTAAFKSTTASSGSNLIEGNTFYGSENTTGVGVDLITGSTDVRLINNIIYGFTTGVAHADTTQTVGYDDYNDYFNNDTPTSGWTQGSHNQAVNPGFANVSQLTGSGASSSSSTFTDATKNFTALGVTTDDYIYLVSGTGVTAGMYQITAVGTTTLTLSPAPGTTSSVAWQITLGHNFALGTNLLNTGTPGVFPGEKTTSYIDIGAVQRRKLTPITNAKEITLVR